MFYDTIGHSLFLKIISSVREGWPLHPRVVAGSRKDILAVKVSLEEHGVSTPCWDPPPRAPGLGYGAEPA